jgi:hypothetical protein
MVLGFGFNKIFFLIKPMNYLPIYLKFIDQIIENHDKRRDPMQKVLKSFLPKVPTVNAPKQISQETTKID